MQNEFNLCLNRQKDERRKLLLMLEESQEIHFIPLGQLNDIDSFSGCEFAKRKIPGVRETFCHQTLKFLRPLATTRNLSSTPTIRKADQVSSHHWFFVLLSVRISITREIQEQKLDLEVSIKRRTLFHKTSTVSKQTCQKTESRILLIQRLILTLSERSFWANIEITSCFNWIFMNSKVSVLRNWASKVHGDAKETSRN